MARMAKGTCYYCNSDNFVQQAPHPKVAGGVPTCFTCFNKIADMNRSGSFPTSGVDALASKFPLQEEVDAYQRTQRVPDRAEHPNRVVDHR